ncbi:MAG TPA: DUF2384 domain-containing protein [Candidatus Angelobacter sp.]|jgi:hypothetical protein|nr:DUF2384 domain-containing protein [Candidatus Angelobacter sp.]
MAVLPQPLAKPDLFAQRESVRLALPELVTALVNVLGKKLVAYICKAKDVRTIDRWTEGGEPYKDAEQKLRTTYHIAKLLSDFESNRTVQSWLMGLNPQLGDVSPARLLRENDIAAAGPEVLRAARAFLAGG